MSRTLTIATLFPRFTSASADDVNATALVRRAAAREITARHVTVERLEDLVDADVYLLGGTGRDGVAALVEALTAADLPALLGEGGTVFAVDAGLDALASTWVDPSGDEHAGLGVAPVSVKAARPAMGTVVTRPSVVPSLPALVGWEWNDVKTVVHGPARPLFELQVGRGNRAADRSEGVMTDRLIGTRLHGPLLALNPELSDVLLALALGLDPAAWPAVEDPVTSRARSERITEALGAERGRGRLARVLDRRR